MHSEFKIEVILILAFTLVGIDLAACQTINFGNAESDGDSITICEARTRTNNFTLGVCVSVKQHLRSCPPLHKLYANRKWEELRTHFCVPRGSTIAKVCCPLDAYNKVPAQDPEPDYRKHRNFRLLPLNDCGMVYNSAVSNIIGGLTANPGDFPWMARIALGEFGVCLDFEITLVDPKHKYISYACGGTIISKRYILTAAHCFKKREYQLKHVQLAEYDEDVDTECIRDCIGHGCPNDGIFACSKPIEMEHEELIIHEGYQYQTGSGDDIALIRLKYDINITNWFTRPICLPFVDAYNIKNIMEDEALLHKKGYVAGWGVTSVNDDYGSSTMKYALLPIVPVIQCQLVYRGHGIEGKQLCAGGERGKDTCLGDSGSPLMYFAPTKLNTTSRVTKSRNFQVGIVSYGRMACGTGEAPVVYTRVRSYLEWILDNMKP